jgi:hypothetical protein
MLLVLIVLIGMVSVVNPELAQILLNSGILESIIEG